MNVVLGHDGGHPIDFFGRGGQEQLLAHVETHEIFRRIGSKNVSVREQAAESILVQDGEVGDPEVSHHLFGFPQRLGGQDGANWLGHNIGYHRSPSVRVDGYRAVPLRLLD